jgi:hypothetical protein
MKFIEKNNKLFVEVNGKELLVENAWKQSDGKFHLVHGWYIYPEPMSLDLEYEIDIEDKNTCRIIKPICITDLTK